MTVLFHFPLLGEPLSLDLVNTCVRRDGVDLDLLDTPQGLATWLRAESARLAWSGAVNAADLAAVRALRAAVAALMTARRDGGQPPPAALRQLNAALSASTAATGLTWTAEGPQLGAPTMTAATRRVSLLHTLAVDAVAVLTGPSGPLLRECAHPDCVLQFIATNPRRLWCSAASCGNRTRVARHYLRQRIDQ